jgi:hypothetical protein
MFIFMYTILLSRGKFHHIVGSHCTIINTTRSDLCSYYRSFASLVSELFGCGVPFSDLEEPQVLLALAEGALPIDLAAPVASDIPPAIHATMKVGLHSS